MVISGSDTGNRPTTLPPPRHYQDTHISKEELKNVIPKRERKLEERRKREKRKQSNVVEKKEEKQEENKV